MLVFFADLYSFIGFSNQNAQQFVYNWLPYIVTCQRRKSDSLLIITISQVMFFRFARAYSRMDWVICSRTGRYQELHVFLPSRRKVFFLILLKKIKNVNVIFLPMKHFSGSSEDLVWNCSCAPDLIGIWKCWFLRRGEQGREPTTNSTHIWHKDRESNPGPIGFELNSVKNG